MPAIHLVGELIGGRVTAHNSSHWFPLLNLAGLQPQPVFATYQICLPNNKDTTTEATPQHLPWQCTQGQLKGRTFICSQPMNATTISDASSPLSEVEYSTLAIWNQPIECTLSTQSLQKWPSIIVTVYALNSDNQVSVVGYGTSHIPATAGSHSLRMWLHRPMHTYSQPLAKPTPVNVTLLQYIRYKLGLATTYIEYVNPRKALTSLHSRFYHTTATVGYVWLSLNVIHQGFNLLKHVHISAGSQMQLLNEATMNTACFDCKVSNTDDAEKRSPPDDINATNEDAAAQIQRDRPVENAG